MLGRFFAVAVLVLVSAEFCSTASASVGAIPPRWASIADLGFTNFTPDNGLPNPVVEAIAQDGDGFIWIGTQNGIARWDGYRFHLYKADPGDPRALHDSYILALQTDRNGTLWVGMSAGGVARYNRDTDTFTSYDGQTQVRAISDGAPGELLIGTPKGMQSLNESTGVVTYVSQLANVGVARILREPNGALWVGGKNGLFHRALGRTTFTPVPLPITGGVTSIFALFEDSRQNVWIGTRGYGAYEIRAHSMTPLPVNESGDSSTLGGALVLAFAEPNPREVWIATYSQGIVVVDGVTGATHRIQNDPTLAHSLISDSVWSLLTDRAGLLWIGTGEGLSMIDPAPSAIVTIRGEKGRAAGISDSDVNAVAVAPNGLVWLGLGSNGVDIFDPTRGRVGAIRPNPSQPQHGLPVDRLLGFALAPNGSMLMGTPNGLYRADSNGAHVTRVSIPGRDPTASVDSIRDIGGDLWIGGSSDGVWRIDMRADPSVVFHASEAQFGDQNINALEPAPNDTVWVGTSEGLYHLNARTRRIDYIAPQPSNPHGLGDGTITALATDGNGRLWVATLGDGISVLTGRTTDGAPQFRRIGLSDGLPNPNADMLLRDRHGFMWVSTDKGLARIDPVTFAVRSFTAADGLQISAYWGNSGAITPQGELLFGGGGGLTVVRPDDVRGWQYPAPVVVTDVRVGERPVTAVRSNGGTATPAIDVPADRNEIAVEFSALDYSAPEMNLYQYRLDGFDRDWIATDSSRRTASYTNLAPGNYTLRVRGSNRSGAFGRELAIPIRIEAAWYQTIWFHLAELVTLVLVMIFVIRLRTAYLRQRERELERIVRERTAELEQTSQALQAKSQALEDASLTDPLTGLRNRRFLTVHLESDAQLTLRKYEDSESGTPYDADLIFFMIDIDHFKAVNDAHGHAAGDAVLVQMRGRIDSVFRESDYRVRWGGEEFLIVSRGTPRASASVLAERIRVAVSEDPFVIEGGELRKTCSVGFAAFPFVERAPRAFDWEEITNVADIALYAAKNAGRNAWVGIIAPATTEPRLVERLHRSPQAEVVAGTLLIESNLDRDDVMRAFAAVKDVTA